MAIMLCAQMSSNVQPPKCRVQVVQHMLEHGRKEDKKRILVCVKTSGSEGTGGFAGRFRLPL